MKEQIAEKLGWIPPNYMRTGCVGWMNLEGNPSDLPDWENSLDAQARDIWKDDWIIEIQWDFAIKQYCCRINSTKLHIGYGTTRTQACWNAICEVMKDD